MDPHSVSIGLALIAGLVSFLSPCVLSLVPAYVGYLSSRSLTPEGAAVAHRWDTVAHGLAFVLGFSAAFVALGAAASAIGAVLFDARGLLTKVGGGVFSSAGWAPCVGPVLGAVLTLALTADAIGRGVGLLAAYSLGLGIPFLIAAAGVGRVSIALRRYRNIMRYASLATGSFLILIGLLVFTDSLQMLASFTFVADVQTSLDEGVAGFWRWLTGGGG